MGNNGESGDSVNPRKKIRSISKKYAISLLFRQNRFPSDAIASSSDFNAPHPFSVRCSFPPLLPEGMSLSSSVSFLNLLISADAWGTLIPVAMATSLTVELLSARYLRILLLFYF